MDRVSRNLLCFLVAFSMSCAAVAQSDNCQDFRIDNGDVTITAVIAGEEYPAALTTSNIGASITLELVRKLGLKEKVNRNVGVIGTFGRPEAQRYINNLDLQVFGANTTAREMTITGRGQRISLSLRLFEDFIIQLDFPNSKLCFFPRKAIDMRQMQNIDLASDAQFGDPVVKVKLNNKVDTWLKFSPSYSGGVLLDSIVAEELGLYDNARLPSAINSQTLANTVEILQFGPFEMGAIKAEFPRQGINDNLATRSQSKVGTNIPQGTESRGSIGIDVLRHFVVTIDLKSERMHLFAP